MMNTEISQLIETLSSTDNKLRLNALQTVLDLTNQPVEWVYEAWDAMVARLWHQNSYQRSIGIMVLCNLAKSDHEGRINFVLDNLLSCTKDEKFITSRQCIQNIWKVAVTSPENRERVINCLEQRLLECREEDHFNLLRLDIMQSIRQTAEVTGDRSLLDRAWDLAAQETEAPYRKKYEAALRN